MLKVPPPAPSTPVQRVEPTVVSYVKRPSSPVPVSSVDPQPPTTKAKVIPVTSNKPIGLNVADFLPVSSFFMWNDSCLWFYKGLESACVCVPQSSSNHRPGALSEEEALSQIRKGHDTMCVMLSSRLKNLQTIQTVWSKEGMKVRL